MKDLGDLIGIIFLIILIILSISELMIDFDLIIELLSIIWDIIYWLFHTKAVIVTMFITAFISTITYLIVSLDSKDLSDELGFLLAMICSLSGIYCISYIIFITIPEGVKHLFHAIVS